MRTENKKQIVFIDPKPTVNAYRMARSLKLTGRYKTILFSFSETLLGVNLNDEFFKKAFDEVFILKLSHKIKFKDFTNLFKNIFSKEGRNFFIEIKKMNPYIFQIGGPDLFSAMVVLFLKKNSPKVYYANDIWAADKRNFLFTKDYWIKGEVQKFCEKICFRTVDGALSKKSPEEFETLGYSISIPRRSLLLNCLDDWMFSPKKKKNKEIHFTFGGDPAPNEKKMIPFIDIIEAVTSQKIYFHTYGPCIVEKENKVFVEEAKKNKYYCYHGRVKPSDLTKEMSEFNYGVVFHFFDASAENTSIITDMSSRFVSYIEAGLPIIVNRQNKYMAETVEKYKIGVVIDDFQDIKNIRKILEKENYSSLQKNVKKVQETFKLSRRIKEIESFYEEVIKIKEEKQKK